MSRPELNMINGIEDISKLQGGHLRKIISSNTVEKSEEIFREMISCSPANIGMILEHYLVILIKLEKFEEIPLATKNHFSKGRYGLKIIFYQLYALIKLDKIQDAKKFRDYWKVNYTGPLDPMLKNSIPLPPIHNDIGFQVIHFWEFGVFHDEFLKNMKNSPEDQLELVKSLFLAMKFKESYQELMVILKKYPNDIEVLKIILRILRNFEYYTHHNLGFKGIDFNEIIFQISKKCMKLDPENTENFYIARSSLWKKHDFEELQKFLKDKDFFDESDHEIYADSLERQGKYVEAISKYRKLLEKNPTDDNIYRKILKLTDKLGQDNEKNYNDYLTKLKDFPDNVLHPGESKPWNNKYWNKFIEANLLFELGKIDQAISAMKEAKKLNPKLYIKHTLDVVEKINDNPELFKIHKKLKGSNFYLVEYNKQNKVLEVRFNATEGCSSLYRYFNVPDSEYKKIISSKGKDHGLGSYKYEKI